MEKDQKKSKCYCHCHKEDYKEKSKCYCHCHKEDYKEKNKCYCHCHKEDYKEKNKCYCHCHKEDYKEKDKCYRHKQDHKEKDKCSESKLEEIELQLQLQQQSQLQLQQQLQRQSQAQAQNDTDTISNIGNPVINIANNIPNKIPTVDLDKFPTGIVRPSAFRAVSNANLAVPANTPVKVLYQVEQFDLANEYFPGNSSFIPSESGVYLIIGSISFDPNNNNLSYRARVDIRVNGVSQAADNDFFGPSNFNNVVSVSSILRLQTGDVVEIFAESSIAGVITPLGENTLGTHFEAARFPSPTT